METYKIELNKKELFQISKLLNKEVKNNPELMVILSKLSLAYYEPLTNEIGEFINSIYKIN